MIAVLEGRSMTTRDDLHDALSKALDFPNYYGRNLDALWDCLTGWIDVPVTVVWKDYSASKEALGEYAERVAVVLREAASEIEGFEVRLE